MNVRHCILIALLAAGAAQAAPDMAGGVLPFGATAACARPAAPAWRDMASVRGGGSAGTDLAAGLQGTWLCAPAFGHCRLRLDGRSFAYEGTGGRSRGAAAQDGPYLLLETDTGERLDVIWQMLGDGRLSINGGEAILHREGRSPTPTGGVREFGNRACRFRLTAPADATIEEIEDGVRMFTLDRDAGLQIVSGETDLAAREFSMALAKAMGASTPREEEDGSWSFARREEDGSYLHARVQCRKDVYIAIFLTGDVSKLAWVAGTVRVVDEENRQ